MVLAAPVAVGTPATMAEGLHSVVAAKPAVEAAGAVDAQNAPTAPWKTQRTRFPQLPPPSFFIPKRYKVVGGNQARLDQALTELLPHWRFSFVPYAISASVTVSHST